MNLSGTNGLGPPEFCSAGYSALRHKPRVQRGHWMSKDVVPIQDLKTPAAQGALLSCFELAVGDPISGSDAWRDVIGPAALRPVPIRLNNNVRANQARHPDGPPGEVNGPIRAHVDPRSAAPLPLHINREVTANHRRHVGRGCSSGISEGQNSRKEKQQYFCHGQRLYKFQE